MHDLFESVYDPGQIEEAIQKHWVKSKIFEADEDDSKEKFYCLCMFPYLSLIHI